MSAADSGKEALLRLSAFQAPGIMTLSLGGVWSAEYNAKERSAKTTWRGYVAVLEPDQVRQNTQLVKRADVLYSNDVCELLHLLRAACRVRLALHPG